MHKHLTLLHLVWFRGFKSFTFDGFKPITVIGGKNNAGKSSILEAIYYLGNRATGLTPGKLLWNRGEKMRSRTLAPLFYGGENSGEILIHGLFANKMARGVGLDCTYRTAGQFGLEDVNDEESSDSDSDTRDINGEAPPTYVQQFYDTRGDKDLRRGAMMIVFTKDEYRFYPLDPQSDKNGYQKLEKLMDADEWKCWFYQSQRRYNMVEAYKRIFEKGKEGNLLECLKSVDTRIQSISFDGDRLLVAINEKDSLRLPLGVMGDGMVKVADILSLMVLCDEGGTICVDEIENGLHYSVMHKFWSNIVQRAQERNIQLIVTTHNLEMMQALTRNVVGVSEDFAYINLTRTSKDEVVANGYDYDEYEAHIKSGVELR